VTSDVYLFGAGSMLGWSIWCARDQGDVTGFCNRNTKVWPPGVSRGIHLNDEDAVAQLFAREQPQLIVHCAGVCDVEVCETAPDFAHRVNVEGTRLLLEHAPPTARIVYCSSDHVFGGDAGPYYEDSATRPISADCQ
jgi:dTDP-4-dehydrorhamnose reductase